MSKRTVYTAIMPDGSNLMVEAFVNDQGVVQEMWAATRPRAHQSVVWDPPTRLEFEGE